MGLLGDLGKEFAGALIDGALEGMGMKGLRQDLQKLGTKLNDFIEDDTDENEDTDFSNIEKLYGLTIVYLFFLSDDYEDNDVNPNELDASSMETFIAALYVVLLKIMDIEDYEMQRFTELLKYSIQYYGNPFETTDVCDRSELCLKKFFKFINKNFEASEIQKSMADAFIYMHVLLSIQGTSKCQTESSRFRYYIFAKQANFSKLDLLKIVTRIFELLDMGMSQTQIIQKINLKYNTGYLFYAWKKKLTNVDYLHDDEVLFDKKYLSFEDLEEYIEEIQKDAIVKSAAFIISRKKEALPEEIETICEYLCEMDFFTSQEELSKKVEEEIQLVKQYETFSEYFKFVKDLNSETKYTMLGFIIILIANIFSDKIEKNERPSPNYIYNFYLLKKYFKINKNEYEECLKKLETDFNIPAQTAKNMTEMFTDESIDYIRQRSPEICEEEDLIKFQKRKENLKKEQEIREQKEKKNSLKNYVINLYDNKALKNDADDFFSTKLLVSTNKNQKQVETAIKSYAKNLGDNDDEQVLLIYNSDAFGTFKSGFVLTNKRIYVKPPYDDSRFWVLSDIKEITAKKGLMFYTLKVNDYDVDSAIVKKYTKQVEILIEILNQIISYCINDDE